MEMHPQKGSKTWTSGNAVPLSTTDLWVRSVIFQAKKVGGDNTSNIHLGPAGLDVGSAEVLELAPGDIWEPDIRDHDRHNLKDIYLDAETTGDGVTWIAWT